MRYFVVRKKDITAWFLTRICCFFCSFPADLFSKKTCILNQKFSNLSFLIFGHGNFVRVRLDSAVVKSFEKVPGIIIWTAAAKLP
jgi:hypothetical protein